MALGDFSMQSEIILQTKTRKHSKY